LLNVGQLARLPSYLFFSEVTMRGRDVYPVKYYSQEGFVEHKIELDEADLAEIIEEYLSRHADFDFDEVEIINNRPMNVWLYAKCRKYVANVNEAAEHEAEVEITGDYDDNPTGR
jgi:hypothetical protein